MVPIPIGDNVRRSHQVFWFSTFVLIAANVGIFLFIEVPAQRSLNRLVYLFGIIPARYTTARGIATLDLERAVIPIFTSMFLHGGWLHLLGNMLFLFVFGRSIEDRFGHLKFLIIYFISGFCGALLHIFFNAGSRVPSIGASGAIAGVLGAYFVTFPRARIKLLIWLFILVTTVELPAVIVLGYWFLIQFFSGFEMLAIESATAGGVAWWAHVGGFITGIVLGLVIQPRRPRAWSPEF